ncbi:MAG TPA: glycoside hydrolase family 172 protein [Thermomicrobiales bacterium]|nr:glycoside hydrolase family 172 protein [Thermomicrobiales bacterium]
MTFDGLGTHIGNLARRSHARTRSISAENPTGALGQGGMVTEGTGSVAARDLGQGWKVSPSIDVAGSETVTLAEIEGPGAIQHIWLTVHPQHWRSLVLRMFWDGEDAPSVEVPLGDFFCNGWCQRSNVASIPVAVNPAGGFNSYWQMPFRRSARATLENLTPDQIKGFYYQITWTETGIPEDSAYLHAQWRRSNLLPYGEVHTLLDGVEGFGHYVGTYIALGQQQQRLVGRGRDQVLHGCRR